MRLSILRTLLDAEMNFPHGKNVGRLIPYLFKCRTKASDGEPQSRYVTDGLSNVVSTEHVLVIVGPRSRSSQHNIQLITRDSTRMCNSRKTDVTITTLLSETPLVIDLQNHRNTFTCFNGIVKKNIPVW